MIPKDDLKPMICTSTEQEMGLPRAGSRHGYSWISKLVFSAKGIDTQGLLPVESIHP